MEPQPQTLPKLLYKPKPETLKPKPETHHASGRKPPSDLRGAAPLGRQGGVQFLMARERLPPREERHAGPGALHQDSAREGGHQEVAHASLRSFTAIRMKAVFFADPFYGRARCSPMLGVFKTLRTWRMASESACPGYGLTHPPGHLWRDKWTALSGQLSAREAARVHRVSSSLLGPVDPSFRALSGREPSLDGGGGRGASG